MTYTLTRSKRKTIALHICDGNIEVRAPLRMPKYAIDEFVILNYILNIILINLFLFIKGKK